MLKIELVWRELLYQAIDKQQADFTITNLSNKLKLSTSVIAHSLIPLRQLGMIIVGKKKSTVVDAEKLLFFWATRHNLIKDIIYTTHSPLPPMERETSMPPNVVPTAYSAYRLFFGDPPADYDNIYFYANNEHAIKKRFPPIPRKKPNIYILKSDNFLATYPTIPTAQIFADLWNLSDWYAKEFTNALLLKIKEKIGL